MKHTVWRKSKLSACHLSIFGFPIIVTHCLPLVFIAYLHPPFSRCGSISKSYSSISAIFSCTYIFCAYIKQTKKVMAYNSFLLYTQLITLCCTWTTDTSILRVRAVGGGAAAVGQMSLFSSAANIRHQDWTSSTAKVRIWICTGT